MTNFNPARAPGTLDKLSLLAALYFAQGVPFGFFTQALPVVMRQHGYALEWIGLSSLLALPWALKWLWAPVLDSCYSARFGRRRSWLLTLQVSTGALMLVLAAAGDRGSIELLLVGSFLSNLLAATQDVASDGLAVEVLNERERGLGNGVQVAAYRLGMILGGGALLAAFDRFGWPAALGAMAFVSFAVTLPVLAYREAPPPSAPTRPRAPFARLLAPGMARWCLVLVVYKGGDALATGMVRPYLVDAGATLSEIAVLVGAAGSAAGLVGALAGGILTTRLGSRRALLVFGLVSSASVSGYALLAGGELARAWLGTILALEHFAGGLATVALFTGMMQWCRRGHEGSDYTLQASLVVIATGAANAASGFSARALGYPAHFWLAAALAFAAALFAWCLFPRANFGPALERT